MSGVRASSIRIESTSSTIAKLCPRCESWRELVLHVVAQVVEAELVVGAVGDVAGVGLLALLVVEPVHDGADAEAQEAVDPAHPLGVAGGEVVVDGDDVDAQARQGVEVDRQGRHQGLALAGAHLGDAALVQHHAADELHVEVALAEHALGRLAHGGEGGHEDVVEGLAGGEFGLQHVGAGAQRPRPTARRSRGSSALISATRGR